MESTSQPHDLTHPVASQGRRRRRYSAEQKAEVAAETYAPGMSAAIVARKHGIAVSQIFAWRRAMEAGKLTPENQGQGGLSAADAKKYRDRIRSLERMLGRKTEEVEILQEAVRLGREKKLISRAPLRGLTDFE